VLTPTSTPTAVRRDANRDQRHRPWLAKNFPDVLRGQAADIELPDVRFVVGDLGPPVTLT